LGDLVVGGKILSIWILKEWDISVWTGFTWLRTGTSGRLL